MYTDINYLKLPPFDDAVNEARAIVTKDIDQKNSYMKFWFLDEKWEKNKFDHCDVLYKGNEVVALCGNALFGDTLKIFCHLYVIKKFRKFYPSIHMTNILPSKIDFAKNHNLNELWYTIHTFDKRHERLSDSQKYYFVAPASRNVSMPDYYKFEYKGKVTYNYTEQDKFSLIL